METLKNWCLLCAQINVSELDINVDSNESVIVKEQIMKYLGLKIITQKECPQSVCKMCTKRLRSFDVFVTQCKHVHSMFADIFKLATPVSTEQLMLLRSKHRVDEYRAELVHDLKNASKPDTIVAHENNSEDTDNEAKDKFECEDSSNEDEKPVKRPKTKRSNVSGESKRSKFQKEKRLQITMFHLESNVKKENSDSDLHLNDEPEQSVFKYYRWECYICNESCRNFSALQSHCKEVHDSSPKITCVCGKTISSRTTLRSHRMQHSNNYFKCVQCSKAFIKKVSLEAHMASHNPKEVLPHICCHCGARYNSEARLRTHEVTHTPEAKKQNWPCPHCSKVFNYQQVVDTHIKCVHLKERGFVCHECGHAFFSNQMLNEHLLIHSEDTPFVCHCGKRFKTANRLKLHSDTHQGTNYKCSVCSLILNTKRTLRQHLAIHRDTRAYSCSVCHKGFKRYTGLKAHEILHSGLRPYSCQFCECTFTNGSNCRSHKLRKHPEQLAAHEAGQPTTNFNEKLRQNYSQRDGQSLEKNTDPTNVNKDQWPTMYPEGAVTAKIDPNARTVPTSQYPYGQTPQYMWPSGLTAPGLSPETLK